MVLFLGRRAAASLCSAAVQPAHHPTSASPEVDSRARRPAFVQLALPDPERLRSSILDGLMAEPAHTAPSLFYDELGSHLFSAITALDEYYPTRTEQELLARHLPAIAAAVPVHGATLVDLGAGDCKKAASLFGAVRPQHYVAVDVSVVFLRDALQRLQLQHPRLPMTGVGTDFSSRLELPPAVPHGRRLFFYPGSSIGNFTPDAAVAFLRSVRTHMRDGSVLWIGVDLQKPVHVLERAYDDELGVTAAFDRNLLRHLNKLVGTDFVLADWRHLARYDADLGRIEMHLEAVRDVQVRWPGGGRHFAKGARIHTENSYKHTLPGFTNLLARAGLRTVGCWTDPRDWFAFFVAVPDGGSQNG